jgi:hypothetical protein
MRRAAVIVLACLLAGGCGTSTLPESETAAPSSSEPVPTDAHTGASQDVSAQQCAGQWPLTTDRAIIGCRPVNPPDTSVVGLFVNDGGSLYGLNGTALGDASGNYKDLHTIWKPGTDTTGLQDAARELC